MCKDLQLQYNESNINSVVKTAVKAKILNIFTHFFSILW